MMRNSQVKQVVVTGAGSKIRGFAERLRAECKGLESVEVVDEMELIKKRIENGSE